MSLSSSAQKVQDAMTKSGIETVVRELPSSTRTAVEAATSLGCEVAQIAKSIIFESTTSGRAILAIACGDKRVDENLIATRLGEKIKKASPDFVLEKTGYAIGGVPPLGHRTELICFFDKALLDFDYVWTAAGTPHAVCRVSPQDLKRVTNSEII